MPFIYLQIWLDQGMQMLDTMYLALAGPAARKQSAWNWPGIKCAMSELYNQRPAFRINTVATSCLFYIYVYVVCVSATKTYAWLSVSGLVSTFAYNTRALAVS